MRDAIKDPRPGDIVMGLWAGPFHVGSAAMINCLAVCGDLIAVNTDAHRSPNWIHKSDWCRPDAWIKEFIVVYQADDAAAKCEDSGPNPIETAPKDGKFILLWAPERQMWFQMRWSDEVNDWVLVGGKQMYDKFTHWTPMPAPPEGKPL